MPHHCCSLALINSQPQPVPTTSAAASQQQLPRQASRALSLSSGRVWGSQPASQQMGIPGSMAFQAKPQVGTD